jgi:hypothetical protein
MPESVCERLKRGSGRADLGVTVAVRLGDRRDSVRRAVADAFTPPRPTIIDSVPVARGLATPP